uniref:Winged helix-turn-helix domain-containing protein n=1 Tax=Xenopsylla cheopis TaxID=163159 RepID=A0A6M2DFC6_XENCH
MPELLPPSSITATPTTPTAPPFNSASSQPQPMEQIVMTPRPRREGATVLLVERKAAQQNGAGHQNGSHTPNGGAPNSRVHVAGGDHTGIVINKDAMNDQGPIVPATLSLEFRVFLVSATSGNHSRESRILRFWFRPSTPIFEHAQIAQEFFRELVSPQDFPRDYVGFIKKIMKLLQHSFKDITAVEVELRQLDDSAPLPARPLSSDDSMLVVQITVDKVLELIESAYPNPITIQDIAQENNWDESDVADCLKQLQEQGLVKAMELDSYTRVQHQDTEIQVVKQMPAIASNQQPTIAVVTANYCEKLAVDAMLDNKETFVRYTTVGSVVDGYTTLERGSSQIRARFGESNVYTLGNIGRHRIVSTKLPAVGHTREALTAAGNTTTRLLGTFQKVEYVILVGVAGGVPHYTDYGKHVRLGDVVVSATSSLRPYVYVYHSDNPAETKTYKPNDLVLEHIARELHATAEISGYMTPWSRHMEQAQHLLSSRGEQQGFERPPADTDKLYMSIGERDVIEVEHPSDPNKLRAEGLNQPRLHLGAVCCGRNAARGNEASRSQAIAKHGALAFDMDMDAVVESVIGNCRDSFICIRGIADYRDGSRGKEWQPYASLAAASVMKALVCALDDQMPRSP